MIDFTGKRRTPRLKQNRIILHFDYDCFYAQVIENATPALKAVPLGIKQKSILATCNYAARARGVTKLQSVAAARQLCPDLVLVDGEDLTPFRDVSKRLYGLLCKGYASAWSGRAERLGLDEIFLDATDMVAYNAALLNRHALENSWFCLSREDPAHGFAFDASAVAGCVVGNGPRAMEEEGGLDHHDDDALYVKLVLASHLARHIRLRFEEEGYTSACGIATNKVLAKLVGSANKPRNQTTLLSLREGDVRAFMDAHGLRKVPGFGGRITHTLESFFLGTDADTTNGSSDRSVTVGQLRTHPAVSPQMLEKLLGSRPGAERGIGERLWALLHGCDESEVKAASSVPTQISIEDTYPGAEGGLNTMGEIEREMLKLGASLLRRMHVDLTTTEEEEDDDDDDDAGERRRASSAATANEQRSAAAARSDRRPRRRRWLAHPKTLRLTTRPKTAYGEAKPYNWGRISRSQPLPTFVFLTTTSANADAASNDDATVVAKLVKEALLPMFSAANPGGSGWNIGMINICVANMVPTAAAAAVAGAAGGSGRDISHMFRVQEDVLREFRVRDEDSEESLESNGLAGDAHTGNSSVVEPEPEPWDDLDGVQECGRCGHCIPQFAVAAHQRFHDLGDV